MPSSRTRRLLAAGAAVLGIGLLVWCSGLGEPGAGGAAAGRRPRSPAAAPATADGRGGIPDRAVDPAGSLRVPDVDPKVLEAARRHVLSGNEIRLERPEDAVAFAELSQGPAEAIPSIAVCIRKYLNVSGRYCDVNLVGRFERIEGDPDGRSRLVAVERRSSDPVHASVLEELGPKTEAGRDACRRLQQCMAAAVVGRSYATPLDMRGVGAWSSILPMDADLRIGDFGFFQPGEDLSMFLDELLDEYRDAQPWLRDGVDVASLEEAGRAYCREKFAIHGPKAEPLIAVCMSNVPLDVRDYLRVRELRKLVEP